MVTIDAPDPTANPQFGFAARKSIGLSLRKPNTAGHELSRVRVWNQVLAAKFKAEQEIDVAEQKAAKEELEGKADGSQSARTPRKSPTEKSSPERSVRGRGSPTRSPKAASKKEEKMRKQLEAFREKNIRDVQEAVMKQKQTREEYFTQLLDHLKEMQDFNAEVSMGIREHASDQYRCAAQLCDKWHARVFEPTMDRLEEKLHGSRTPRSIGLATPRGPPSGAARSNGDPVRYPLSSYAEEEHFRRIADRFLKQKPVELSEMKPFPSSIARYKTKPTLEPTLWDAGRIDGTPFGHFAKVCEDMADGHPAHSLRRQHIVLPSEDDGVPAAGKRRTRFEFNDLGMLKGDIRDRGQAVQFKRQDGAGCAVPLQDHYTYETGTRVVDNEFDRGKKIWRPTPGSVPRDAYV
jgi:hypothetical protein